MRNHYSVKSCHHPFFSVRGFLFESFAKNRVSDHPVLRSRIGRGNRVSLHSLQFFGGCNLNAESRRWAHLNGDLPLMNLPCIESEIASDLKRRYYPFGSSRHSPSRLIGRIEQIIWALHSYSRRMEGSLPGIRGKFWYGTNGMNIFFRSHWGQSELRNTFPRTPYRLKSGAWGWSVINGNSESGKGQVQNR